MRRRRDAGFTLVEVVIALSIIALVTVTLLSRRLDIVRDAAKTRDRRVGWVLASWKMGKISTDVILISGSAKTESGNFEDLDPSYAGYRWAMEAGPVDVQVDPTPGTAELPRKLFKVRLEVFDAANDEPLDALEAMFPIPGPPGVEAPPDEEPPPDEEGS